MALPEGEPRAGDTAYLQFTGLLNPQEKLATAYNFNFSLRYAGEDGTYFRSNPGGNYGIYDFSGNPVRQRIAVTVPKYWAGESYSLHGALQRGGFAGVSHRSIRYATGNDPQLSTPAAAGILSRLPDVTLALAPTQFQTGTLTFIGGTVTRSGLTVTLASEAAIRAARVSYDLLSTAQKALVENYADLTAAERALAALKKAEQPAEDEITVTFRLIGADKSAEDVDLGAETGSSVYRTWIATRSYTLPAGSTVGDLFLRAAADAGLRQSGAEDGYVSAIWAPAALGGYRLGDMDNGSCSGWMYMVNGSHPGLGLNARLLADKDAVMWHYVNDYAYEVRDWFAAEDYPALGDETTWVDRSAVPDFDPVADDDGETKPETPAAFVDVAENDWFHDAAYWAAAQGITQGQGSADTFAPHAVCTRAEIVTMLYRLLG